MTDTSMDFLALIQKSDDGDFLKTIAEVCVGNSIWHQKNQAYSNEFDPTSPLPNTT